LGLISALILLRFSRIISRTFSQRLRSKNWRIISITTIDRTTHRYGTIIGFNE